jgi:predicted GTPase
MNKITILLIGRTGSGKSALANVISNDKKFNESGLSISETRDIQIENFEIDGVSYQIIDTVGIGDTKLTTQQVLNKLADASYSIKEGLNQILFATDGRFKEEEIMAYDLLRSVIFDTNVANFTTIVRTKFPEFENPEKCEEDRKAMLEENQKLSEIIKTSKKVIHVDNLPETGSYAEVSKKVRENSRTALLTYLRTCQDIYKPENLDGLNERINSYMTEKDQMNIQLTNLNRQLEEMKAKNLDSETLKAETQRVNNEVASLKEKEKVLQDQITQQTQQHVQQKEPGFFQKAGDAIDTGIRQVDEGITQAAIEVKDNCKVM